MYGKRKFWMSVLCMVGSLSLYAQEQIYVSPRGNDKADGSLKKPLRTIQAAVDKASQKKDVDVEIVLRGGAYELDRTVEIGKGLYASLRIKPYGKEAVSVSGGRTIALSRLKKVSNPDVKARLQPQVSSVVRELDLRKLGIDVQGLRPSGFGRPSSAAWTELFMNEQPLQIARWPNDSTVLIGKVLKAGTGEHVAEAELPVFCYNEDRPSAWKNAGKFWIGGYFAHGYADDMIPVEKIDPSDKTIHPAMQTVYGFMTGADWRRWYALNLLEELDLPGEYVIDEEEGKMYAYPKDTLTSLHVSVLDEPLVALEHCSDVTLENLTFEYGRYIGIYLEDTKHVRIQGCTIRNMGGVAVSMGKGSFTPGKVTLKPHAAEAGGEPTSRVIGDLIGKVYQETLYNREAGSDNGIVDCYIYHVGAGGVSLGGGDRASLTPANNFVENCRIHDFNRIEKSYRPGVWIDGVGNRVSQCDIYNAPSMAILFHGNNHVIEYCKITNVCGEVDDQGAIYYGRDPSEQGNVIRYCYFHKLSPRHRVTATYHDDGACGGEVYGNIYHNAGSLPVLIGGGHYNHYHHNLFIDSPCAIHLDNRMQNWGTGMVAPDGIIDQRLKKVRHTEPPYSEAYPKLVNYWQEDPAYPHGNLIESNLFYRIGNVVHGETQWAEFRNNWITNEDPGFVNPDNPLEGFKTDADLFKYIPGFPQLPFDKIGSKLP